MTILAGFTSLAEAAANSGLTPAGTVSTDAAKVAQYCSEGIICDQLGMVPYWVNGSLITEGWIAFNLYFDGGGSFASGVEWMMFGDQQNLRDVISIESDSTAGTSTMEAKRETANTTLGTTSLFAMATRYRMDIHWRIADSGGIFRVYRDNVLILDSAVTDTLGNTSAGVSVISFKRINATCLPLISAVIVADEDTRGMIYTQQLITGNGASQTIPGGFGAVDEVGINDADGLTIGAIGQKSTFTKAALDSAFATGFDVLAVCSSARAIKGALSASQRAILTSSSAQTQSASQALAVTYASTHVVAQVDPNTGVSWTIANANAAEVGVECVA